MSRRGRGEGSSPLERSDGLWSAYVTLGYINGRPKRQYVYGKTRRACAEKLKAILGRSSSAVLPDPEKITAVHWLEQYISNRSTNRAPGTLEQWRHCVRRVKPYLETYTLERVTPTAVQFALSQLRELAPATRQKTLGFMHQAFEEAVRLKMIRENPVRLVETPKGGIVRARVILQPAQVIQLMNAATGTPLEAMVRLGYSYGLRIGELLALRWSDWEPKTRRLSVRHSLERTKDAAELFRPAKKGSTGNLLLDETTAAALESQRLRVEALSHKVFKARAWTDHKLIFPSVVGTPLEYHNVLRSIADLCEKAGVPYAPPHTMRRTYISLALRRMSPREVADVVRHKTTRTTMEVYAQTIEGTSERAAVSLETLLDYTLTTPTPTEPAETRGTPITQNPARERKPKNAKPRAQSRIKLTR
jgi:integrase